MKIKLKQFILLTGDIFFLYLSLYLTLCLRYRQKPDFELWQGHFAPFTIAFALWLLFFYILNLYSLRFASNNSRFYKNSLKGMGLGAIFALAYFYLAPNMAIAPKTNLLIFIAVFTTLFLLWRNFFNWIIGSRLPKKNIAIIGFDSSAQEMVEEIKNKPHLGLNISFIFDDENKISESTLRNIPIIKNLTEIKTAVIKSNVDLLILSLDPRQSTELNKILFSILTLKVNFTSLPNFYEEVIGKVPVSAINQSWFLENLNEADKKSFDLLKKLFDFGFAFFALAISAIFWPFIAILIKLESRGPIFIRMERCGQNGQPFKMYKFRSMREENNTRTPTIANDPRITKFGKFLRNTRLDEIPQLINILRGEMSFVGPRPERPEIAVELEKEIPFYRERELVKPGVTGWDQISGEYHSPSPADTLKKMQYDLFYIKNRSLYLDFSIILKTIATVFSRAGR